MADSATSLSPSAAGSGQNFSADDEKKKGHKKFCRKKTKGEYCSRNIFKCDTLIIVKILSNKYDNQIIFLMLNLSIWIGRKIFLYSMNRRFGYRINFPFHSNFLMWTDSFNMNENKFSGNSDLLPLTTNRQGGAERGDVVTWQNSANRKHDQRLSILGTVENFSIRSLESKDDVLKTGLLGYCNYFCIHYYCPELVRISFSSYSAFPLGVSLNNVNRNLLACLPSFSQVVGHHEKGGPPLLTVATQTNGGSWEYKLRRSFLG